MQESDFVMKDKKECENVVADCLYRLENRNDDACSPIVEITSLAYFEVLLKYGFMLPNLKLRTRLSMLRRHINLISSTHGEFFK